MVLAAAAVTAVEVATMTAMAVGAVVVVKVVDQRKINRALLISRSLA